MIRTWLVRLLLVIPALALLYFPVTEQLRVWFGPEPDRIVNWQEAGASTQPVGCRVVDLLPDVTVEPAANAHAFTRVSLDEADVTSRRVVAQHRNWPFFRYAVYGAGPQLVYLTLPDAGQYLAWARAQVWDDSGETAGGNADVVFIDARSGDPLLLVTNVAITDPAATCMWNTGEFERVVDPLVSLIGAAIYVLLLVVVWALRRVWRIYRGGVDTPAES